jgi:hypothetical protein
VSGREYLSDILGKAGFSMSTEVGWDRRRLLVLGAASALPVCAAQNLRFLIR